MRINFTIEIEQEKNGWIIAEIPDLPGFLVYEQSRDEAIALAKALACVFWRIGLNMGNLFLKWQMSMFPVRERRKHKIEYTLMQYV